MPALKNLSATQGNSAGLWNGPCRAYANRRDEKTTSDEQALLDSGSFSG
jgi:hypothetical protein